MLSVLFSSEGRAVISGGCDGTIRFWERATGKPLRTVQAQLQDVFALALAPGGRWLASGAGDTTVLIWDMEKAIGTDK